MVCPATRPSTSTNRSRKVESIRLKASPLLDERAEREIERRGRGRVEPALEIEQRVRLARHAEADGEVRDQQLGLAALADDEQRLRLGGEHRLERALAQAIAIGFRRRRRSCRAGALRGAQARDRRTDGKGDDAEIDAEGEEGARVERSVVGGGKRAGDGEQKRGDQDGDAKQHLWPPR